MSWTEFASWRTKLGKHDAWPGERPVVAAKRSRDAMRFGFNLPGRTPGNAAFALAPAQGGWSLWIDADFDARFGADERHAVGEEAKTLELGPHDQRVPLSVRVDPGPPPRLLANARVARDARGVVGDGPLKLRLLGKPGSFGRPGSRLLIDLDGDGTFDEDPLADESFAADDTDARFAWAGGVWGFAISADGDRITLRRDSPATRARPSVALGQAAPEFSWTGPDGQRRTAAQFRGAPVVLEFWSPRCGFCRESAPELAKAAPRLQAAGVHLVSINVDREGSADGADEFGKTWTSIAGADARAIARSYRADSTPTYVLCDAAGTMVARGNWRSLGTRIQSGDIAASGVPSR